MTPRERAEAAIARAETRNRIDGRVLLQGAIPEEIAKEIGGTRAKDRADAVFSRAFGFAVRGLGGPMVREFLVHEASREIEQGP